MNNINALEKYKQLVRKYRRSVTTLLIINLLIFFMLAATTVLNLWALQLDVSRLIYGFYIKILFLIMSFGTTIGATITGILSFLNYKNRARIAREKIELIKKHWTWFEIQKKGFYDGANRYIDLLENITTILNGS